MEMLLLLVPLVGINLWHVCLIAMTRRRGKPGWSISGSALTERWTLNTHLAVHTIGSLGLVAYGLNLMRTPELLVPGAVMMMSATLGIVQVVTLTETAKHKPFDPHEPHQIAAWSMALGYLVFSVLMASIRNLPGQLIAMYIAWLVSVFAASMTTRHRYFWLAQMVFFVSVSAMIVTAVCR